MPPQRSRSDTICMAILHCPPGPPSLERPAPAPQTPGERPGRPARGPWLVVDVRRARVLGPPGPGGGSAALGAQLAASCCVGPARRVVIRAQSEALGPVPGAPRLERGSRVTGGGPEPPTRCRVDAPHQAQQGKRGDLKWCPCSASFCFFTTNLFRNHSGAGAHRGRRKASFPSGSGGLWCTPPMTPFTQHPVPGFL